MSRCTAARGWRRRIVFLLFVGAAASKFRFFNAVPAANCLSLVSGNQRTSNAEFGAFSSWEANPATRSWKVEDCKTKNVVATVSVPAAADNGLYLYFNGTGIAHLVEPFEPAPTNLPMDEGDFTFINLVSNPLSLAYRYENCFECMDQDVETFSSPGVVSRVFSTRYPLLFTLKEQRPRQGPTVSEIGPLSFTEHSSHSLVIFDQRVQRSDSESPLKMVDLATDGGASSLQPLWSCLLILAGGVVVFGGGNLKFKGDTSLLRGSSGVPALAVLAGTIMIQLCSGEVSTILCIFGALAALYLALVVVYSAKLIWFAPTGETSEPLIVEEDSKPDDSSIQDDSLSASFPPSNASRHRQKRGETPQAAPPSGRIESVDCFRGIALAVMIFVNYGGGGYWFFDHSLWNGLTFADVVFPWFVWTMGFSTVLSFDAQLRRGTSRSVIMKRVWIVVGIRVTRFQALLRSVRLFLLGMFLNGGRDLSEWRVLGVLQYFSVSGLLLSAITLYVPEKRAKEKSAFRDVDRYFYQWALILLLVVVYLLVQFFLPVPGCPTGYVGPGGIGQDGRYYNCTGGAHSYVDELLVGKHHMYHRLEAGQPVSAATCVDLYNCSLHDPEGILGYLTCTLMAFLGVQAARSYLHFGKQAATNSSRTAGGGSSPFVVHQSPSRRKVRPASPGIQQKRLYPLLVRWAIWGVVSGGLALLLCQGSQNSGWIPVNKNLWSPSFVCATAGMAFLLASLLLWLEKTRVYAGKPFSCMGKNSILLYAGHELLHGYFPFSVDTAAQHSGLLLSNVCGVSVWVLVGYLLDKAKCYVKI